MVAKSLLPNFVAAALKQLERYAGHPVMEPRLREQLRGGRQQGWEAGFSARSPAPTPQASIFGMMSAGHAVYREDARQVRRWRPCCLLPPCCPGAGAQVAAARAWQASS